MTSAHSEQLADALLAPVRPANAFEETVGRLLQLIRLGVFGPGESIPPERELAVRLGVSRDTLREAIRALADAGFLVSRRGRYGGTFLAEVLPAPGSVDHSDLAAEAEPITRAELDDALRVREILEVGAARMAAGRTFSAAERESLWTRLTDIRVAVGDDYRRLDSRLHLAIAEAAGAPSVVALVADNRMRINRLLDRIPQLERNIAHSEEQHEAIVIAILTGNADAAAVAMRAHVEGTATLLHGFLD
ncbi:FadR/GntR family transcriptional regulator [Gordonia insulae]|uniref:L-lactate dehydrogenase operon regulatory protein n=1 Tax=Gordonia insulae TaxID=2420509 RepID=A0A3G8JEN0_9ACTN|nr:GntR family transcriptional regulator [Gordonia insulae]AZG43641.1 Putative L-lactate dehydrogenase operon regulatory protein [Gordonia insulae]